MDIVSAQSYRNNCRKAIVILGARSGTSALAGILGVLGCTLPSRLLLENWSNPKGHFEPQDIIDIHDELLKSVGSSWSDWREFPSSWYGSPVSQKYRRCLAASFKKNFGNAALSVLKEPRMCRILPLWDWIFEDLALEPAFCFIDRDPMEVAASLQARDGSSLDQGLRYYIRNHLDAEFATRNRRRAFVSYHDLLQNWQTVVRTIIRNLDIPLDLTKEQQRKVDTFLDPNLRHGNSKMQKPSGLLSKIADEVHATFQSLSAEESEWDSWRRFDELRRVFNALG